MFCILCYTVIPFVWQGVLGTDYMLKPEIYSGAGVPEGFAAMFNAGAAFTKFCAVAMFFTVLLSVMTAMSGSSRTLFQGGQDGWLPKYLAHLNEHKVPTWAMWTDLIFNLFLLLMSDYVFVLAVSNCNYMIFNFLNLNAGWIHRRDNAARAAAVQGAAAALRAGHLLRLRERVPPGSRRELLGQRHAAAWAGSRP